ncbi:MAG: S8 family serine peptidase [Actinomycetota bacterium]|nr:S8 family serine peptidase [Actinomycetota bacterium]
MNQILPIRRLLAIWAAFAAGLLLGAGWLAGTAHAADYVPGRVIVGYHKAPAPSEVANLSRRMGVRVAAGDAPVSGESVLRLPKGLGVSAAIARLRRLPEVAYAVPDYLAHAAGSWVPDDPGRGHVARGWARLQWNFLATAGVNAPGAWTNLIADHHPGGAGTVVAVLDTGVAYRNWHQFRRSPDFGRTRFVDPYDFVSHTPYPLDREGHGTFVAGTVAESTNNGIGVTGLAYGASIMPVRILDAQGNGDAATIARGLRYAVAHGANVINLSIEFGLDVGSSDIPDIIAALRYAHRHGVVVVAASGNDGDPQIAYPARASQVISVGATTIDRCLASYSNTGTRLDLVAPGGGDDSSLVSDPNCKPYRTLPDISQMTIYDGANPGHFGLPGGWYGTSMSAPHVSATAALVIASGVLGRHPSPDQVLARLEQTAQTLGGSKPNADYGYGLLDAAAATAPPA